MFRQVVMQTWKDGVETARKEAMIEGLRRMRAIPEVVSIAGGVDGEFFPDNWGCVSILDCCDFDAARRYSGHPDHQAFIAEDVRPFIGRRAVVQFTWGEASVVGFHHVKIPVGDVTRSRRWYVDVLGFVPDMEFVEDGELRGAALRHPVADIRLSLRLDPRRAAALAGFDVTALAVGTRTDLDAVVDRARAAGVAAGPVVMGREGWACDLTDPDGLVVRLYTHQRHGAATPM